MKSGAIPVGVGASVLFRIPLLRNVCAWTGLVEATERGLQSILHLPYPYTTFITPGGIAEMWLGCGGEAEEKIMLARRRGYARHALMAGAAVVPTYYLGNSQLFDRVPLPGGLNDANGLLCRLSRRLRLSLVPFSGRWIAGVVPTLVPKAQEIVAVQGRPVWVSGVSDDNMTPPEPISEPSDAQIEKLHEEVLKEMRCVYEKHRSKMEGWATRKLVMV
jgi:2-acylglycerol O-acyltransferase 2